MDKGKNNITINIEINTTEFEKDIDRCIDKMKELIQLKEQADKLLNADNETSKEIHVVEFVREPYSSVRKMRFIS